MCTFEFRIEVMSCHVMCARVRAEAGDPVVRNTEGSIHSGQSAAEGCSVPTLLAEAAIESERSESAVGKLMSISRFNKSRVSCDASL